MRQVYKPLAIAAVGLAVALGGGSAAFAKAHDQGVADGTQIDPSVLRGGGVAGINVDGVGRDAQGNFLGVADPASGLTYGQDVVQDQIDQDIRRVHPVVCSGCSN